MHKRSGMYGHSMSMWAYSCTHITHGSVQDIVANEICTSHHKGCLPNTQKDTWNNALEEPAHTVTLDYMLEGSDHGHALFTECCA
eukprot:m.111356 g.111356  ORF g.111356 m.111356 type:complete len:85 (-) comp13443_c2_seq2:1123-1377(-)